MKKVVYRLYGVVVKEGQQRRRAPERVSAQAERPQRKTVRARTSSKKNKGRKPRKALRAAPQGGLLQAPRVAGAPWSR